MGGSAVFFSAGGNHHYIGLNTWYSANTPKASHRGVGLFNAAVLYPTRKSLAELLKTDPGFLSVLLGSNHDMGPVGAGIH